MLSPPSSDPVFARDFLHGFRNRNIMILGWATVPFLIPFAAFSFFAGRPLVGAFLALVSLIALVNSVGVWRESRARIPIWVYYGVILVALTYALATVGASVSYWCYPACFSVLFLAERTEARILIGVSLATLLPTAFITLPLEIASRFAVTLTMVCYFSDLVVGIFTELQSRLTNLAVRDPLTGALNRRQMTQYLESAIEESRRGLGPASVVSLDVDHFKQVNDTFGHEVGDRVLQRLVSVVEERARRLDAVFRVGGEEFAVLLRNTALTNALNFAESLRERIELAPLLDGRRVTVSLGVAEYDGRESADSWLRRSDAALYEAKGAGRNYVRPATDDRRADAGQSAGAGSSADAGNDGAA